MRFTYRLAALASTCSLVAAFLVTSGFVCVSPESGSHMADMPGMDMSSMHVERQTSDNSDQASAGAQETAPPSCEFPWAPSGCVSMAPCAPVAVATQPVSLVALSPPVPYIASASPLQPPSETIAPELPPPRA